MRFFFSLTLVIQSMLLQSTVSAMSTFPASSNSTDFLPFSE